MGGRAETESPHLQGLHFSPILLFLMDPAWAASTFRRRGRSCEKPEQYRRIFSSWSGLPSKSKVDRRWNANSSPALDIPSIMLPESCQYLKFCQPPVQEQDPLKNASTAEISYTR